MTVGELIEELKKQNPEMRAYVYTPGSLGETDLVEISTVDATNRDNDYVERVIIS